MSHIENSNVSASGLVQKYIGTAYDNVKLVADNITAVVTIGDDLAAINAVSAEIANIVTVAGIEAEVQLVSTNMADITAVAGNVLAIAAAAANQANVDTVAGNIAIINTVANSIAGVNTVATDIANVNTVAADIANVNLLAPDIATVNATAVLVGTQVNDNTAAITDLQQSLGIAYVAADITARDALLATMDENESVWVVDASADGTVTSGWAVYRKVSGVFVKAAEQESLDLVLVPAAEGVAGIIPIANSATAEAGVNDTQAMTPLKTMEVISNKFAVTNYTFKDPEWLPDRTFTETTFAGGDILRNFHVISENYNQLVAVVSGSTPRVNYYVSNPSQDLENLYEAAQFPLPGMEPVGITMSENAIGISGDKIYFVDALTNIVHQYSTNLGWTSEATLNISAQTTSPTGLLLCNGDTRLLVCSGADRIYQYDLSTARDLSTATYVGSSGIIGIGALMQSVELTPDGKKAVIGYNVNSAEFYLDTPFDITTINTVVTVAEHSFTTSSGMSGATGFACVKFAPSYNNSTELGSQAYVMYNANGKKIHKYRTSKVYSN